jgi:hypothetical protein
MKMPVYRIILPVVFMLLCFVATLQSCKPYPKKEKLVGAWQVDSTFTYYNGFSYTQRDDGKDWATYVYSTDGMMKEIKYGSFQSYFYDFNPTKDTLILEPTQGGTVAKLAILGLTAKRLILRKEKKPLYEGKGQKRYEIRYFSRTTMPADSLIPFKDPRKTTN